MSLVVGQTGMNLNPMVILRKESVDEIAAIRSVVEQAFGRQGEADLVDALRGSSALTVSLVAVEDEKVVGYVAFSPVTIESPGSTCEALGLGPLAVLPARQRRGIGSQLVRRGLDECRRAGHGVVVVLGSAQFYRRFGFATGQANGIRCSFKVSPEHFMVAELMPGVLAGHSGMVRYRPEFNSVSP